MIIISRITAKVGTGNKLGEKNLELILHVFCRKNACIYVGSMLVCKHTY